MSHAPSPCRPFRLHNAIQPYPWGSRGAEAFIPRLLGIPAAPEQPYAELWIGAHPNAPSRVFLGDEPLSLATLIAREPVAMLGAAVAQRFDNQLPFLFKVLSAAEPLSIQAHPDKVQAERLHARDPQHYPDANHKPEVAIALDRLTALAGLKSAASWARPEPTRVRASSR
ncbi:MAG: Mannose-6-phosphate isomerase [Chloroflexi bacterium ADurb.Bin222]|nr:MAG: Mannose-6-phosphate isomerase [Chloroflexi bacterium ADurb.Bin222]